MNRSKFGLLIAVFVGPLNKAPGAAEEERAEKAREGREEREAAERARMGEATKAFNQEQHFHWLDAAAEEEGAEEEERDPRKRKGSRRRTITCTTRVW